MRSGLGRVGGARPRVGDDWLLLLPLLLVPAYVDTAAERKRTKRVLDLPSSATELLTLRNRHRARTRTTPRKLTTSLWESRVPKVKKVLPSQKQKQ